jgi:hypothetical protein
MQCPTAVSLKENYLNAISREQGAKGAERWTVTQMQLEITRTQTRYRVEERKSAEKLLMEHCQNHGCSEYLFNLW